MGLEQTHGKINYSIYNLEWALTKNNRENSIGHALNLMTPYGPDRQ